MFISDSLYAESSGAALLDSVVAAFLVIASTGATCAVSIAFGCDNTIYSATIKPIAAITIAPMTAYPRIPSFVAFFRIDSIKLFSIAWVPPDVY